MGSSGTQFPQKNITRKTALMTAFDCYKTYLAFKNHFTKDNFDYFKYGGKTRASTASFNKRKDKYFFEKMSRQRKTERSLIISPQSSHSVITQKMWIGEIIQIGEEQYQTCKRKCRVCDMCSDKRWNSCLMVETSTLCFSVRVVVIPFLSKNI